MPDVDFGRKPLDQSLQFIIALRFGEKADDDCQEKAFARVQNHVSAL